MNYVRPALVALLVLLVAPFVRADDATGTVVSPAGDAVSGAEVIVATPQLAAWPNIAPAKRREDQRGAATAMTDSKGRFTVNLPKDAGLLCIPVSYTHLTLPTTPYV